MDYLFTADAPKLQKRAANRGEDAPPVAHPGLLIVCDGCGGAGSLTESFRISPAESTDPLIARALKDVKPGGEYTWAYLGSRLASAAAQDYLSQRVDEILARAGDAAALGAFARGLALSIRSLFEKTVKEYGIAPSRGDRTYVLFASTLTAVVYGVSGNNTRAVVFSAGDSHALWWDAESGLQRISLVRLTDGADDFTDNSSAGGCVAGDRDFTIDFASYADLPANGVIFACSDGFTDTYKPFDQERIVCEWLMKPGALSDPEDLGWMISEQFDLTGCSKNDDCSMAGAILGYNYGGVTDTGAITRGAAKRRDTVAAAFCAPYYKAQTEYRKLREDPSRRGRDDIDAAYRVSMRKALKRAAAEGAGDALIRLVCSHPDFRSVYGEAAAVFDEASAQEPEEEDDPEELRSVLDKTFRDLFAQIAWVYGKRLAIVSAKKNAGKPPNGKKTVAVPVVFDKKELNGILSLARDCRWAQAVRDTALAACRNKTDTGENAEEQPARTRKKGAVKTRKRGSAEQRAYDTAENKYKAEVDRFYALLRGSRELSEFIDENLASGFAETESFVAEVKTDTSQVVALRLDGLLEQCRELAARVRDAREREFASPVSRQRDPLPGSLQGPAREFIAEYKSGLVGMVFADHAAFYECTGVTYEAYTAQLAAAEDAAGALRNAAASAKDVWSRYRPGYERYRKAAVSSFAQDQ